MSGKNSFVVKHVPVTFKQYQLGFMRVDLRESAPRPELKAPALAEVNPDAWLKEMKRTLPARMEKLCDAVLSTDPPANIQYVAPGILQSEFSNGTLTERVAYDMSHISDRTIGEVVDKLGLTLVNVACDQRKSGLLCNSEGAFDVMGGHIIRHLYSSYAALLRYGKVQMVANKRGYLGLSISDPGYDDPEQGERLKEEHIKFLRSTLKAAQRQIA